MVQSKFGIYLNAKESKVVRITSPYWLPEEPDWVYLTPEVNETLAAIRQMAQEKGLVSDVSSLAWGSLPLREE